MTQLSLFGSTPDQNTFQSEKWGRLTFFPTHGHQWKDTCRHCLLWSPDLSELLECNMAPCQSLERTDGKNGYYSIHNYPKQYHHGNN